MSVKRQATSELNHENWDQEDPSEREEMGTFKSAPKDILEKRVIRTAKRRVHASGDDAKKGGVFSGFGGFNKTQPSSFDFLANLTNGNKPTNGSGATSKNDASPSSNLFTSKPGTSSPSSGLFTMATTSSSPPKSTFGIPTSQPSLLFGAASSTAGAAQSPFAVSKTESPVTSSPFKIQTSTSSPTTNTGDAFKSTGSALGSVNSNKSSLFSSSSTTLSPFKTTNINTPSVNPSTENVTVKKLVEKDDKKLKYYSKLKGLNESVSDWIKKHVEETPLCILSPIFKDYEKHLKKIQDEYHGTKDEPKISSDNDSKETTSSSSVKNTIESSDKIPTLVFTSSNKPSIFGSQQTSSAADKPAGFSFGINASNNIATTSAGFSFGVSSTPASTTKSPFSLTTTTTGTNGNAPFSFGIGKPFSFSSNIQKPAEPSKETNDEEDEPPKVEYTPVVEEDSVFDKKCKIFVKKDGNFVDKGVGTLYIKKVEDSGKHQLLVRANTNLGTVLLNLILSSSIPTQRLGKNNVMLACIPTPDAKPPPTPVLIRVKTSEEADDLLETLNKYKA